jgi:hypothetical protein
MLKCASVFLAICGAMLTGCGAGMVDVQGTVKLEGQPLAGVNVTFEDSAKHIRSTGITDAQGKFRLSTNAKNDGAMPGEYKVAVSQPGPADSSQSSAQVPRMFPVKYERVETSGLIFTVKSGGKYDIDLKKE